MNKLRLILLMLAVVSTSLVTAQLKDGEYKKVPELDKFEGTWQWSSGDSTFTICLTKVELNLKMLDKKSPDMGKDVIIGWHSLIVGNDIIQSTMDKKSKKFDPKIKKHSIWGAINNQNSDNLDILRFRDVKTNELWRGGFSISSKGDKLVMNLPRPAGDLGKLKPTGKIREFTLPKNVTFKRIKD